ncbi:hypothetical protein A176_003325 [Myxococcus hansupus]|uniref:Uncharacterized protein n=1 Tax=Pseudomyxococcus hansupus TaxID=1297742 RepID=A0A0H4WXS4_9BACT|nr:hypothetical protein A176_003325 [Myxococcus hansupus]
MTPAFDAAALKAELVARHGEAQRARIERGVDQVAAMWRPEDGDLAQFTREQFLSEPQALDATFQRLERLFEQLDGHLYEISRELSWYTDLDLGPLLPVEPLLAAYDPAASVTEDLFRARVGFVVLLNFPLTTLAERVEQGPTWTRRQWAEARLAGRFNRRVPAAIEQASSRAIAAANLYIAEYNIWMHHLVDAQGRRPFPKGLRLISHWNLRDELKGDYGDTATGALKQRMIVQVMERIITQLIPAAVIDNPRLDWDPFTNAVTVAPAETVEADAPARTEKPDAAPEPDTRYAHLLATFQAARAADPYVPVAPTRIARSFELTRELPEARVRALLTQVLESPLVPRVAKEIKTRLGRELEPQDLWYPGFNPGGKRPEAELDALTRKRYPTAEAFAKDLPRILQGMGFTKAKATWLAERIRVDASRGAGHAMPALRRGDFPRLRTRVEKGAWTTRATTSRCTSWGTTWSRCSASTAWTTPCSRACPTTPSRRRWPSCSSRGTWSCSAWASPTRRASGSGCSASCGRRGSALASRWWTWRCGTGCTRIRTPRPRSFARRWWASPGACGIDTSRRCWAGRGARCWPSTAT